MNTCAFLLILTVQIYADGIEGPTGKTYFRLHLSDAAAEVQARIESVFKEKPAGVWSGCQLCDPVFKNCVCCFTFGKGGHRRLNPRCVTLETHAFHLDQNHVTHERINLGAAVRTPSPPPPKPDIPLRCAAPVFPGSRWPKRVSDIGIQSYASAPSQRNCVLRAAAFLI